MCKQGMPGDDLEKQSTVSSVDMDRIANFKALIYWKNPAMTLVVFGATNLFFFLTYWRGYTVLFLASSLLFYAICASAICQVVSLAYLRATGSPLLDAARRLWTSKGYAKLDLVENLDLASSPVRVELSPTTAGVIEGGLNLFLLTIHEAVWMRNMKLTLATAIGAYLVAQVSLVMDAFTMVYFLFAILFTVPKLWEMALGIDQVLEQAVLVQQHAQTMWTVINDKVISKIPDGTNSSSSSSFSASPTADIRKRRGNSGSE
jgi:hypothetical protein